MKVKCAIQAGISVGFIIIWSVAVAAQAPVKNVTLEGVWEAKRYSAPSVEGALEIVHRNVKWIAQIGAYTVPVTVNAERLAIELPNGQGKFEGRFQQHRRFIKGHWIQSSGYNSPVVLQVWGQNHWRGQVIPKQDEFTIYLAIKRRADGKLGAFLRNPERNMGMWFYLDRIEQQGNKIELIGKFRNRGEEKVLAEGIYHPDDNNLSIYFGDWGGSYNFRPVINDIPGFYARGKNAPVYEYQPPVALGDGWKVGTLDQVGMQADSISELIKIVSAPPTSVHDLDLHGLLIARHGKLVLEEYFHGFHRNKPHDLRSANKVVATTLVGAVIQNNAKLDVSTHVYDLIYGGKLPEGIDPRKKEMTVEHLLTMSSGYDCNDWADDQRPGSEDSQWGGPDRDFYHFTLQLPMEAKPGEKPAYCSVTANVVGAVLKAATGRRLNELFQDSIAAPLQIQRYYLNPQPTGEPYLAGGMQFLPRDFMKFAQLMLDGGVWNGKRVLGETFTQRASSSLVQIPGQKDGMKFGYLWWTIDYPYRGRTLRAYFASGNGGQSAMAIPELDMVIAFYGGNYNDRAGWVMVREYVPKFVLPAVKEDNSNQRLR